MPGGMDRVLELALLVLLWLKIDGGCSCSRPRIKDVCGGAEQVQSVMGCRYRLNTDLCIPLNAGYLEHHARNYRNDWNSDEQQC